MDGKKLVTIFGEKIAVRASVHTLGGFSAHAGQSELVRWYDTIAGAKPRLYLTHGEDRAREPLSQLLRQRYSVDVQLPKLGEVVPL